MTSFKGIYFCSQCFVQFPGLNDDGIRLYSELATKFNKAYQFWYGPTRPLLIVCHPATIKVVAMGTNDKSEFYDKSIPWLGKWLYE